MKRNIEEIALHYMVAAAWSTSGGDDINGNPEHESLEEFEFSEKAKAESFKDCEAFVKRAGALLDGITDEMVGHDFWLTRARHGVGFWDRGLGEQGEKLTKLCDEIGETWLYLGDDGLLHF